MTKNLFINMFILFLIFPFSIWNKLSSFSLKSVLLLVCTIYLRYSSEVYQRGSCVSPQSADGKFGITCLAGSMHPELKYRGPLHCCIPTSPLWDISQLSY